MEELAYIINDKWDKWDPDTMHYAMYVIDGTDIITRKDSGSNPYSFGTKLVNSGIAIWRFKIIKPLYYWVGIKDNKTIKKDAQGIDSDVGTFCIGRSSTRYCNDSKYKTTEGYKGKHVRFENIDDVLCMILNLNKKTLLYSVNNGPFQTAFHKLDTSKSYRMCLSLEANAKVDLVASVHLNR